MVATAIIGSAVVGGVGTAIASGNAAHAQEKAANTASNTELNMYNQNKAILQPYSDQGLQAYTTLNQLLGVGANGNSSQMQDTLNNLPGYQFTLQQGLKSTQNSAAARGLGASGAALKGAANYATGLANSTYGTYANELQNSANTGEGAAAALAGVGTTVGGQVGGNQIGAGNAAAAASNATGNAFTSGANSLSQYYTLNSLLNNTNVANGGGGSSSVPWSTDVNNPDNW